MTFHTAAFFDATSSTVANTQIAAVPDNVLTIRNANLFPDVNMRLLAAYIGATAIATGRLVTASWRTITPPSIIPPSATFLPGGNPSIADYRSSPLLIPGGQELSAEGSDAAGTTVIAAVISIQERPAPTPAGDIFTIRAVATATMVVGAWTNAPLTFGDTLPPGRYAIVGALAVSATCIGFRLRIPGELFRPGGIGVATLGLVPPKFQTKGAMGNWGEFPNDTLPECELLCSAADTALTLFLDLIKVR